MSSLHLVASAAWGTLRTRAGTGKDHSGFLVNMTDALLEPDANDRVDTLLGAPSPDPGGQQDLLEPAFGSGRVALTIKRTLDLVIAGVGVVVLSPVAALIALAIHRASSGPVMFRQTRVGRHGVRFSMLKFRTMVDGAEETRPELESRNESDGIFKLKDDPRLTGVGRLLRRCSLDELPQLINVLRGEMSLVGPRPLVPEEDARIQGPHRARLLMKPGMTGPWQALGPVRPPLREMVVIDCLYVENWSLWADLKILLRTFRHVLLLRGV